MKQDRSVSKNGAKSQKSRGTVKDLSVGARKAQAVKGGGLGAKETGGIRLSNHNETLLAGG